MAAITPHSADIVVAVPHQPHHPHFLQLLEARQVLSSRIPDETPCPYGPPAYGPALLSLLCRVPVGVPGTAEP